MSWFRYMSGGNLVVDWRALEAEAGVSRRSVITMHTKELSLGEALSWILHAVGGKVPLELTVKDGVIIIVPGKRRGVNDGPAAPKVGWRHAGCSAR